MSGPSRRVGCSGWLDPASGRSMMGCRMSGLAPDFWAGAGRRMSGAWPDVRALYTLMVGLLLLLTSSGAGCPGRGRMSRSCSLSPVPLDVLLHPCTWGLVHHSEHLREGLLGT